MTVATQGSRNINMAMSHPGAVDLWEDGSGGLYITTPGCERVLTNLELVEDEGWFAEDAESLENWREAWINIDWSGHETWSIPIEEFQEAVNSGKHELKLVATWIPASDGSYDYANEAPELWLRSSPGRASEKYLGINGEDFWSAEYPVWVK